MPSNRGLPLPRAEVCQLVKTAGKEGHGFGAVPWWIAFGVFAVLWAIVGGGVGRGFLATAPEALFDSDCYMRLLRAEAVLADGEYPFRVFAGSNPPEGEGTAWTLPMDLLLGVAALPPRLMGGSWREALWGAGYWISPCLFLVAGGVFVWALGRAGGLAAAVGGAVLLPLTQAVINMYFPARPDHHGLLHLCWSLAAVATASGVERAPSRWWWVLGGAATALMFWVSLEGGYLSAVMLSLLGMNVVCRGEAPARLDAFGGLWRFALSLWACCAVFVLIEGGGTVLEPWAWDRLSLRHLLGLLAAGLGLACLRGGWLSDNAWVRCGAAGLTGLMGLGAFWLSGGILAEGGADPGARRMLAFLLYSTSDNQAFYQMAGGWASSLLLWFGAPLLIWPLSSVRWVRGAPLRPATRCFVVGLSLAYVPMGLCVSRWNLYGSTVLAFLAAWWLGLLVSGWRCRRAREVGPRSGREAVWLLILGAASVALVGRVTSSILYQPGTEERDDMAVDSAIVALREPWLRDGGRSEAGTDRVLAPIAWGPSVMYHWGARVLGTPYYRNATGMEQSFAWLCGDDPERALKEARARGWRYALMPAGWLPPEIRQYDQFLRERGEAGAAASGAGEVAGVTLVQALCGEIEKLPPGVRVVAEVSCAPTRGRGVRLLHLGESGQTSIGQNPSGVSSRGWLCEGFGEARGEGFRLEPE